MIYIKYLSIQFSPRDAHETSSLSRLRDLVPWRIRYATKWRLLFLKQGRTWDESGTEFSG